jgi:hypothetical protein
LALGGAAPAPDGQQPVGPVDVAVVAPDRGELRGHWLEDTIRRAGARLDGDAIMWVIVPRRWRWSAERILRSSGLVLLEAVLTVPPWPGSAHLIPLSPAALGDAGPRHLGLSPDLASWLRTLAGWQAVRRLLSWAAPGCALLAARAPAPDPLRWLAELDGVGAGTATVAMGPRRDARVAVVMRLPPGGRHPDLVVKTALDAAAQCRVERERAAIAALGPEARQAGAAVPSLVSTAAPWLLAAGALPGSPASTLLSRNPQRLSEIAGGVSRWLRSWNAATASAGVASGGLLERALIAPAERLAAGDPGMGPYLEALRALAGRLEDKRLVLTAAHNDLTMSNVLVSGDRLGIVDWEGGVAAALPLTDLWYALTDSVVMAHRVSPAEGLEALIREREPVPAPLARAPAEHAGALALTPDQALLGFHACWLHHAANEQDRQSSDKRFIAVVRNLARTRLLWPADDGYTPE